MKTNQITKYMSSIGRKGGLKSKRALSSEAARNMVRVREARRAFSRFHSKCFWSYDPDYIVCEKDIEWVADLLMRFGGKEGWELGERLCP